ncbi:MAG: LCP family protein, partial [Patescibacteria group bacterium]
YRMKHITDEKSGSTTFSLFSAIRSFVTPSGSALQGEKDDRVNILLTGIGGEGHDGPQLTDTILFASYRPSTKKLAFLSLPRDMRVDLPGHGSQKINHANAYAEMEQAGSGPTATAEIIGNVLHQPIQYYLRVDFDGFSELINSIGGIDVYIEQPFTDPSYPILGKEYDTCGNSESLMKGKETVDDVKQDTIIEEKKVLGGPDYRCRFEKLTFKEGWTHMDGYTALAFVRSRHGNNGEGSDFARSRRQQKILLAVKDKVFSVSTFFNPVRMNSILDTLQKNIRTNLTVAELVRLGKEFKNLTSESIVSHVIDASPNSPLYETSVNGAYVLLPKNDDWTQLQQMAQYIFTPEKNAERKTPIAKTTPEPLMQTP